MIFAKTVTSLLEGNVICRWTNGAAFRELQKDEFACEIADYVAKINKRLAVTPSGEGYHLTETAESDCARKRAAALFKSCMRDTRYHLLCFNLFMRVFDKETAIAPGDSFTFASISAEIHKKASLQTELGKLRTSAKEPTLDGQLEKLVIHLIREGIIIESVQKTRTFLFTGMVEVILDYIVFIVEAEEIPVERQTTSQQGGLW